MQIFLGVIVGFIVLTLLVVAHEFGHFIAAVKSGVKVNEFGVGFPPRAIGWIKKQGKWTKLPKSEWGKPQKSLIISLNWLPIGGFCTMNGESDADTKPHTFGATTFWQKTKILFGGVIANWLIGFIILTILAWTGMPLFLENQFMPASDVRITTKPVVIQKVQSKSPAAKAKLKPNDQILKANRTDIMFSQDLVKFNQKHANQTVKYTIKRGEKIKTLKIKLNPKNHKSKQLLGVTMSQAGQPLMRTTWSAPIVGAVTTAQITKETFKGLGDMVYNLGSGLASQFSTNGTTRSAGRANIKKAGDSVSGPVGIIGVIFPAFTAAGPTNLAFLAALISISLACLNVLPIPALDGGRWLLIAIFRLRGKKLSKETENRIVSRAFVALLVLITLITILDISRFIK